MRERRPKNRRARSSAGFSMVELLVTMLLLTIALLGLAALQIQVVRGVTVSRRSDEATRLGQGLIERYMTQPVAGMVATAPLWFTEWQRDGVKKMTDVAVDGESPGPFTVQSMIELLLDGSKLVTIKVSWVENITGAGANPSYVVLSTRRAGP